jgi:hypothetical protein
MVIIRFSGRAGKLAFPSSVPVSVPATKSRTRHSTVSPSDLASSVGSERIASNVCLVIQTSGDLKYVFAYHFVSSQHADPQLDGLTCIEVPITSIKLLHDLER